MCLQRNQLQFYVLDTSIFIFFQGKFTSEKLFKQGALAEKKIATQY